MVLSSFSPLIWRCVCILAGIVAIQGIIAFHELGHWLFCKLFGIRTPSFSIGFGPRLWSKKIGETTFALSAIPLGGYVEIAGVEEVGQGDQKEAFAQDAGSFGQKPYYQKLFVLLGGIFFNLLFAFAAFVGLWFVGMPKSLIFYHEHSIPVIEQIIKDSPAEKSGLKVGQKIIGFNETSINTTAELLDLVKSHKNQTIVLHIAEETTPISLILETHPHNTEWGYLGAFYQLTQPAKETSILSAAKKALKLLKDVFVKNAEGIAHAFAKKSAEGMGGPLRLFAQTAESLNSGLTELILLMAMISIGLAVINLLPLPIFDGGQIVTYTIEALIGRQLPEKVKYAIHIANVAILFVFILYISFKDSVYIWKTFFSK